MECARSKIMVLRPANSIVAAGGFNMSEAVGPDCGNGGLERMTDWTKEDMCLTKADPEPE